MNKKNEKVVKKDEAKNLNEKKVSSIKKKKKIKKNITTGIAYVYSTFNNTIISIADENGVAIIQEGDAQGKNGEYDNKYVWIFKMKDGLIYSIREYNSDILVATQLYDYKLTPIDN